MIGTFVLNYSKNVIKLFIEKFKCKETKEDSD